MMEAIEEPLIYTSKGNVPIDSLQYRCGWEETETATVFWEEHWDGEERVKRSVHARSKYGVQGVGIAADLNGV